MADPQEKARAKLESEQLFRSLFLHMGEGVALHEVVLDAAGQPINYRILEVNPQFAAFTGLSPERVVGKLATEAYDTPTPPYFEDFTAVGLGGTARRFETYFAPHDRYYEISVAPMGVGFFATIFMDVSDRRKQEKALRDKTEELDRFFSLAIDLLCIASVDGRFLRVNSAWARVLGWTVDALEGKSFLDFVHPDDMTATHATLAELAAGKAVINFTNRYRAHDGTYRSIEWRSAPGPDGRIYAAARDITQRVEYERALRASEDRLRRIFDLVPTPLVLADTAGCMIDCNDAFCDLSKYTRTELIGHDAAALGLGLAPDQRDKVLQELAAKGEVHDEPLLLRCKDGSTRSLQLSARSVDISGMPSIILVAEDITERQAMERQLLHTQKLESLGVLAGGIAHDFNNLLTGILGNADLALLEMSPGAPARELIDDINAAARRASELCRQLLAYSGKGRFVVQPLDLAELVRGMGHLLSASVSRKVLLRYHFAPNLPPIEADSTQVRQVVMNLVVNASEAIAEQSGVISVSTGLVHCDAAYLQDCFAADGIQSGDFVAIEISDSGPGMDRPTQERIFDPFFTTKFTGRGLGLAAVLGILRGHRGAIRVHSEPGRGTTFTLLFPPSAQAARQLAGATPKSVAWPAGSTILVVDDEEAVRKTSCRMLERIGLGVLAAADGGEAVEVFRREQGRISMVVLDLTMPKLDGEACFRQLRAIAPDVKVLLTSGFNEQDAVNRFTGKGLAGFLQKPFTAEELIGKVREILS